MTSKKNNKQTNANSQTDFGSNPFMVTAEYWQSMFQPFISSANAFTQAASNSADDVPNTQHETPNFVMPDFMPWLNVINTFGYVQPNQDFTKVFEQTNPLNTTPFVDNLLNNNLLNSEGMLDNETMKKLFNEALRMSTQANDTGKSIMYDLMEGWRQLSSNINSHPGSVIEEQMQLWQNQMQLLQQTMLKMAGKETQSVVEPQKGDNRFKHDEWSENPLFDFVKQSYLLTANSMLQTINSVENLDDKTRQRLLFFTRQWLNAMAPSNFLWSNPEVLRLTMESGGKNLWQGLKQLAEDMEKSADALNIRMTDTTAFKVGENIATTKGKVVFRNRMMELIQYTPTTEKVHKRPLLIIPPWVNKFYILDLKEKNSFIRWALSEGHSVFVISWVNPDPSYKDVDMTNYMHEGLLTALENIEALTGEASTNVIGYCIGGILLSLTLAWLTEKGQAKRIASATFWATMFDFSDPGDIGVFIDENTVSAIEKVEERTGVFDGRIMSVAFSLLRENSLYWNYYIQNYLKGERPIAFDLLYWNSDCTNVPAAMHRFALRELYLGNKLLKKGELVFDGVKVDLSKVTTPSFIVATLQDHIVKWKGSYQATQVLGGKVKFVLGESGHIAGIINPPTGKYGYYSYNRNLKDADQWYAKAKKNDASWWLAWKDWIAPFNDGEVDARIPGVDAKGKTWEVLCDAPGEYVQTRAEDAIKQK